MVIPPKRWWTKITCPPHPTTWKYVVHHRRGLWGPQGRADLAKVKWGSHMVLEWQMDSNNLVNTTVAINKDEFVFNSAKHDSNCFTCNTNILSKALCKVLSLSLFIDEETATYRGSVSAQHHTARKEKGQSGHRCKQISLEPASSVTPTPCHCSPFEHIIKHCNQMLFVSLGLFSFYFCFIYMMKTKIGWLET